MGLLVEEAPEVIGAGGVAQLPQRLRFDLANTLPSDVKLLPDFLEGVIRIHIDAKTHT